VSRLRTLKPGFFLDDELAECPPLTRLLFAGLWVIADREGRLEDRPKRIKTETLPYDDCDVDAMLGELCERGFIVRYESGGRRFIAIPTWAKHQSPHVKEAASTIPAPDGPGASRVQAPDEQPSSCSGSCLGSGNQVKSVPPISGEIVGAQQPVDNSLPGDFERWWAAYGRVGSKARARDLYLWWRRRGHSAEELLTAADAYVAHCSLTDCRLMHGTSFLAKPGKDKSPIWPEWATGEPHGSMDVRGTQRAAEVLTTSMDAFAGVLGGNNGRRSRYPSIGSGRPAGTAPGGADARRGLPPGELADGE
jgi:hypothetical protein